MRRPRTDAGPSLFRLLDAYLLDATLSSLAGGCFAPSCGIPGSSCCAEPGLASNTKPNLTPVPWNLTVGVSYQLRFTPRLSDTPPPIGWSRRYSTCVYLPFSGGPCQSAS